jgi:hypothetical protein
MTLIEVLVSMGIFLFLGFVLVTMLRQGLSIWRTGDARRESLEQAQTIIEHLTTDLSAVYTETGRKPPVRVKFIADIDPATGAQRLRFVKTIRGEAEKYLLREAGGLFGADSFIDENHDWSEAYKGILKPAGGLCEVAYVLLPDNSPGADGAYVLWRGICAPIGDPQNSVFNDANMDGAVVERCMTPFGRGVLHMGLSFWTQYTNTWDPRCYTRISSAFTEQEKSGPMLEWDSTRGYIPLPGRLEQSEFALYRGTPNDPSDDIFPSKIRITLVVRERGDGAAKTTLSRALNPDGSQMQLSDGSRFPLNPKEGYCFVFVGGEWIEYGERKGDTLVNLRRGARRTQAAAHRNGETVETGRTISFVVSALAYREAWYE